jgi:hypothetical protein
VSLTSVRTRDDASLSVGHEASAEVAKESHLLLFVRATVVMNKLCDVGCIESCILDHAPSEHT